MRKLFRVLFKSVLAVLAVLIVTIVILIFAGVTVNLDFIRGGVETAASKALDREVTIEGPVELELSYWPALDISDVKIANAKGGIKPNLLNAGFARMQLGIFPLLKGEINIADITAQNVTLNLESDLDGNPNWVFGKSDKASPEQENEAETKSSQDVTSPLQDEEKQRIQFAGLNHLSLSQISVNYHDAALEKSLSFLLESMEGSAAEGQPIELKLIGQAQDKDYNLVLEGGPIADLFNWDEPWGFETRGDVFGKQVAGKGNMLLSGEQPEVHLALGASDIDVGAILAALGLVDGMQASLGDVGIDVTVTGDSLKEVLNKSSIIFAIKQGNWTVTVPNTEASFDINSLDGIISVEKGNNVTMVLDGAIEDVPVKLLITSAPLVEFVTNQEELPLSIDAELLDSTLSFESKIKLPISSTDMSFALKITSERISRLNNLLNLNLPPLGPVSLESKLDITPQGYNFSTLNLKVRESDLNGSFKLDILQAKPKLDISLVSEVLQLDDFSTIRSKQSEGTLPGRDEEADPAESQKMAGETKERGEKSAVL